MKRGFRKGFTLIELLIVLAVIAALLAVVTPVALNAVRKANLTKIASNLRNIKSAAETYVTMNYEDLNGNIEDLLDTLKNGYLTTDPNEGLENSDYFAKLEYSTDVSTVTIWYEGGGADAEKLKEELHKIYSEVSTDTTYPQVQFTVGNW